MVMVSSKTGRLKRESWMGRLERRGSAMVWVRVVVNDSGTATVGHERPAGKPLKVRKKGGLCGKPLASRSGLSWKHDMQNERRGAARSVDKKGGDKPLLLHND